MRNAKKTEVVGLRPRERPIAATAFGSDQHTTSPTPPSSLLSSPKMSLFRLSTRALAAPLRVASRQPAFAPSPALAAWRSYSASALTADSIKARIVDVLQSFEKVDPAKVRSPPPLLLPPLPRLAHAGSAKEEERVFGVRGRKDGTLTRWWGVQVSATASFTNDLGLDSLDAVEVVMAIEGAFGPWRLPVLPQQLVSLTLVPTTNRGVRDRDPG